MKTKLLKLVRKTYQIYRLDSLGTGIHSAHRANGIDEYDLKPGSIFYITKHNKILTNTYTGDFTLAMKYLIREVLKTYSKYKKSKPCKISPPVHIYDKVVKVW
jgi:hypothetical protein